MDEQFLKDKIKSECETWYALGCDVYKITPKPLTVVFKKIGSCAGEALSVENKLNFNLVLACENYDSFIKELVPHEVAHLIANQKNNENCGHGYEWEKVMIKFGVKPVRCHSYEIKNPIVKRTEKFLYSCSCGIPHPMGKNVHGKIQKGRKYICSKCRQRLVFSGD